jgi:hypothetical protein
MRQWKAWHSLPESDERRSAPFSGVMLARIAVLAITLDNRVLFGDAYYYCEGRAPLEMFRYIGMALIPNNLESLMTK